MCMILKHREISLHTEIFAYRLIGLLNRYSAELQPPFCSTINGRNLKEISYVQLLTSYQLKLVYIVPNPCISPRHLWLKTLSLAPPVYRDHLIITLLTMMINSEDISDIIEEAWCICHSEVNTVWHTFVFTNCSPKLGFFYALAPTIEVAVDFPIQVNIFELIFRMFSIYVLNLLSYYIVSIYSFHGTIYAPYIHTLRRDFYYWLVLQHTIISETSVGSDVTSLNQQHKFSFIH